MSSGSTADQCPPGGAPAGGCTDVDGAAAAPAAPPGCPPCGGAVPGRAAPGSLLPASAMAYSLGCGVDNVSAVSVGSSVGYTGGGASIGGMVVRGGEAPPGSGTPGPPGTTCPASVR